MKTCMKSSWNHVYLLSHYLINCWKNYECFSPVIIKTFFMLHYELRLKSVCCHTWSHRSFLTSRSHFDTNTLQTSEALIESLTAWISHSGRTILRIFSTSILTGLSKTNTFWQCDTVKRFNLFSLEEAQIISRMRDRRIGDHRCLYSYKYLHILHSKHK